VTSNTVSERVARFVRHLRREGFDVGIRETQDALRLATADMLFDPERLRHCLRSLCCRDREDWRQFESVFAAFWFPHQAEEPSCPVARIDSRRRHTTTGLAGATETQSNDVGYDQGEVGSGAGRQRTLSRADFRFLMDRHGQRELEHLAERLALRIRKRTTRRRREHHRGRLIHLRRTFRKSLATGGQPLHLRYLEARCDLPRIVLIQDVSHSMAGYSPLLTRFARGLLRMFPRAEAFVFHTQLYRVSHLYRELDAMSLKRRIEAHNHLWFGGTQIAESLDCFQRQFAPRLLDRHSLIIILSDGFDSDDPDLLAAQLATLRRQCHRLVWINPMLGRRDPGNEPDGDITRGLANMVDFVAPGHSIEGLEQAVDYLAPLVHQCISLPKVVDNRQRLELS